MPNIEPINNNPTLGYRLDPYEPGLIRQAKANQSTAQVVAHEHRNLTRLTRQAVQEGRIIVSKTITYKPVIAGSYMGTAAGRTTVVSLERPSSYSEYSPEQKVSDPENYASLSGTTSNEECPTCYQSGLANTSIDELSREELDIKVEISRIAKDLNETEQEISNKENDAYGIETSQDSGKLRRELEEKKDELRKIQIEKVIKSQTKLIQSLNEGLLNSYETPLNMINAKYNGNNGNNDLIGQNVNLNI